MMWLRKSKKGFTLIELMVVVAIIAVLALLGLRLYSTQQIKAKEALVRANAGTIQVAIQTELVDTPALSLGGALLLPDIQIIQNPFTGGKGLGNAFDNVTALVGDATDEGFVYVAEADHLFTMNSYGDDGRDLLYELFAQP
ncbi:unnamed protein product [marine sediment metagenome]|uniref:Type II secretion system protein GspG C-terminal domain-containing protein n=1 Tax=marine sediment metagenome TaxID=412755 RepID=X1AMB7_9ZZZZ